MWIHTDQKVAPGALVHDDVPQRARSVLIAFEVAHVGITPKFNAEMAKDLLVIIVGFKP
jgi:hypothetical protein